MRTHTRLQDVSCCPWCGRQPILFRDIHYGPNPYEDGWASNNYETDWTTFSVRCSDLHACGTRGISVDDRHRERAYPRLPRGEGWVEKGHVNARELAITAWEAGKIDMSHALRVRLPSHHHVMERSFVPGYDPLDEIVWNRFEWRSRVGTLKIAVPKGRGIARALMKRMPIIVSQADADSLFEYVPWPKSAPNRLEGPVSIKPYLFTLIENDLGRQTGTRLASITVPASDFCVFEFELLWHGSKYSPFCSLNKTRVDTAWLKETPIRPPIYDVVMSRVSACEEED